MRGDGRPGDQPEGGTFSQRRARSWPSRGQIGIAVVIGLVVAVGVGLLRNPKTPKPAGTAVVSVAPSTAAAPTTTGRTATTKTTRPPTATTRPASTTTARRAPTTTVPTPPATHLLALTIAAPSHQDSYARDAEFGGWRDVDGCKDTRAVLLISQSQVPVTFTTARECTVKTGRWVDPWSGIVANKASSLQIDHTVPLENAWISGAWSWSHAERVLFTNDLADADHLVPIIGTENEAKGDDAPDTWRPPNRAAWCRYAFAWDHIKAKWHLTATPSEWSAVQEMHATC